MNAADAGFLEDSLQHSGTVFQEASSVPPHHIDSALTFACKFIAYRLTQSTESDKYSGAQCCALTTACQVTVVEVAEERQPPSWSRSSPTADQQDVSTDLTAAASTARPAAAAAASRFGFLNMARRRSRKSEGGGPGGGHPVWASFDEGSHLPLLEYELQPEVRMDVQLLVAEGPETCKACTECVVHHSTHWNSYSRWFVQCSPYCCTCRAVWMPVTDSPKASAQGWC